MEADAAVAVRPHALRLAHRLVLRLALRLALRHARLRAVSEFYNFKASLEAHIYSNLNASRKPVNIVVMQML